MLKIVQENKVKSAAEEQTVLTLDDDKSQMPLQGSYHYGNM